MNIKVNFCINKIINLFFYIRKRKIEKIYGKVSTAELKIITHQFEPIDILNKYTFPGFQGYMEGIFCRNGDMLHLSKNLDYALLNLKKEIVKTFREFDIEYEKQWIIDKKELIEYKKRLECLWHKFGKNILRKIEVFFETGWKMEKVNVYLISKNLQAFPKSNPLIFPFRNEKDYGLMEILTHELLHIHSQKPERESLWGKLALELYIKRIQQEKRKQIMHALIYSSSSNIVKQVMKEDFLLFHNRNCNEVDREISIYASIMDKCISNYLNGADSKYKFCQKIVSEILNNQ